MVRLKAEVVNWLRDEVLKDGIVLTLNLPGDARRASRVGSFRPDDVGIVIEISDNGAGLHARVITNGNDLGWIPTSELTTR